MSLSAVFGREALDALLIEWHLEICVSPTLEIKKGDSWVDTSTTLGREAQRSCNEVASPMCVSSAQQEGGQFVSGLKNIK